MGIFATVPAIGQRQTLLPSATGAAPALAGAAAAGAGATGTPTCPLAFSSAATRSLSRAISWRSASSVSARRARSAGLSVFMARSGLERDQAVLLRRPALALGLQILQRLGQVFAR